MQVVVASRNPVKIRAVEAAIREQFPGADSTVTGIEVESGVSVQPLGDDETLTGARNRVNDARQQVPDADAWVGLEGGISKVGDTMVAFAWIVISDRHGRRGEARSATLPLPPAVRKLLDDGVELGEANDRVFGTTDSKQAGGAFGLLTDGRLTRESVYHQTVLLALVPLVHESFSRPASG